MSSSQIQGSSVWHNFKIGDILTLEYGKSLKDYREGKGTYDVFGTNGKIGTTESYLYDKPSLVIGRKGAYRGVHLAKNPFFVIDTAFYTKNKIKELDINFIYNWFKCIDINLMDSGSAIPSTNKDEVYDLDISLPPLPEQKAIASILSNLDEKIDLLHRQNETLEAMAETIFRQWFVEDAQEDLDERKLGDVIEIFDEKRIPLSKMERDKKKNGKLYPYYGAAKVMDYINDYLFDGEYILLGEDGTVRTDEGYPVLQYATGKFWVNNHTHVLKAKQPYSNFFLWNYLRKKNIDEIITGAVQPKINQGNLKSIPFPAYNESLVKEYVDVSEPLLSKIKKNKEQIEQLEKLRNTLLPKLMSGEVRVAA